MDYDQGIVRRRRVLPPSSSFFSNTGGGGASYTAQGVFYDGTNDAVYTGSLTGASSNKVGILSFWILVDSSSDDTANQILNLQTSGFGDIATITRRGFEDDILIQLKNAGGTNILVLRSTGTIVNANGWTHVLASWDLASSVAKIYIDDADVTAADTLTNDTINWGNVVNGSIGTTYASSSKSPMNLADFYLNTATSLDLTNSTNRRKFVGALGATTVDLGTDGSTPTGSAPFIYMSGAVATWPTNKGSGGGFTQDQALTASSSNPP